MSLSSMRETIRGKKTYIVATLAICHGVIVTGFADGQWQTACGEIFAGLIAVGFRSAMASAIEAVVAAIGQLVERRIDDEKGGKQ